MSEREKDVTVPVIAEELHADAIPVETGGVRITKRVEGHEEILEQELRKGRVEVKRVRTDRVVDGPQSVRREGNTLIVPVVSEVLRVEKQWVLTEEIYVTQVEERETVQEKVQVNREVPIVERLDDQGNAVASIDSPVEAEPTRVQVTAPSVLANRDPQAPESSPAAKRKVMSRPRSILRDKAASS